MRACAQYGQIGCCDTPPLQHATRHFRDAGHPVARSFEPGEERFYDYRGEATFSGPSLAAPWRIRWIRRYRVQDEPCPRAGWSEFIDGICADRDPSTPVTFG
ncbi:UBP-type zinc finger domain-containing protein [Sphingomonas lycopersici]|uniref:UBP-type zinc finger domain-containing protein n=1 Tax=Sphingomonas lycopersici TaxID=2951807 RepID=UPI003D7B4E57